MCVMLQDRGSGTDTPRDSKNKTCKLESPRKHAHKAIVMKFLTKLRAFNFSPKQKEIWGFIPNIKDRQ